MASGSFPVVLAALARPEALSLKSRVSKPLVLYQPLVPAIPE